MMTYTFADDEPLNPSYSDVTGEGHGDGFVVSSFHHFSSFIIL